MNPTYCSDNPLRLALLASLIAALLPTQLIRSTCGASMILCLLLVGAGQAAVPRAFVSTGGNDANPGSTGQACRSFSRALTVVQPGGEIVVQNSGGYSTGFTITQAVTIDAGGSNASVISTNNTDLCTINAGASDAVVLRGINFHGANVGNHAISVTRAGSLYVERGSITEFVGNGINISNGGKLFVTDTDVRRCSKGLIVVGSSLAANLVAHNSRFTECAAGVDIHSSGIGVVVNGWLSDCAASLCSSYGFVANADAGSIAFLTLTNCRAIGNNIAIASSANEPAAGAGVAIANWVVTRNELGIGIFHAANSQAFVYGTSPATNLIFSNQNDGQPPSFPAVLR